MPTSNLHIARLILVCFFVCRMCVVASSNPTSSSFPGASAAAAASTSSSSSTWNTIDRCWRRAGTKWSQQRKRLADCAIGFGRQTTGGKAGEFYVVTSSADDAQDPMPGTLRYGAIQDRPLWIYFAHDMTITLANELLIGSDKTLDGRGANVHIAFGPCLTIAYVNNVIVHGLHIHDCQPGKSGRVRSSPSHIGYRRGSDGDGISIFAAHNVWIDHNSLASSSDGLIDVIHASSLVTISNNYFSQHDKVMLLGHSDAFYADKGMRVTVAFNHFGPGLIQRMPRCRFGYFHIVNNDYEGWGQYAIGGSAAPTIVSEGNRFRSSNSHANQVTKREGSAEAKWRRWTWRSIGDTFVAGAYFLQSGSANVNANLDASHTDGATAQTQSEMFAAYMTASAGALSCSTATPC